MFGETGNELDADVYYLNFDQIEDLAICARGLSKNTESELTWSAPLEEMQVWLLLMLDDNSRFA